MKPKLYHFVRQSEDHIYIEDTNRDQALAKALRITSWPVTGVAPTAPRLCDVSDGETGYDATLTAAEEIEIYGFATIKS